MSQQEPKCFCMEGLLLLSACQKNQNHDTEGGRKAVPKEESNVGRWIAAVVACAVLVGACAVTWIFQDWQTSLQVLAILVVVYIIGFHWRWIYVAIRTAPRDLS